MHTSYNIANQLMNRNKTSQKLYVCIYKKGKFRFISIKSPGNSSICIFAFPQLFAYNRFN